MHRLLVLTIALLTCLACSNESTEAPDPNVSEGAKSTTVRSCSSEEATIGISVVTDAAGKPVRVTGTVEHQDTPAQACDVPDLKTWKGTFSGSIASIRRNARGDEVRILLKDGSGTLDATTKRFEFLSDADCEVQAIHDPDLAFDLSGFTIAMKKDTARMGLFEPTPRFGKAPRPKVKLTETVSCEAGKEFTGIKSIFDDLLEFAKEGPL